MDYALAGPRRAVAMAKAHKERYLVPGSMAWVTYKPLLAAMRRAASSPDPRAELDKVVAWSILKQDWRGPAFRAAANGFLELLPAGATGVKVGEPRWSDGDLTIVARDLIGLRCPDGRLLLVAPYCKEPALDQESADILLYILESVAEDVLPARRRSCGTPAAAARSS
jgi:hypothetical protein